MSRAGVEVRDVASCRLLLGNHRNGWCEPGQPFENHRFTGFVGGGDRRGAGLGLDFDIPSVVVHDDGTGLISKGHDLGKKLSKIDCHR